MNDQIVEAIEQVFDELDAETTQTHYPTDEIVTAVNRRAIALGGSGVLVNAAFGSAMLTTFYAGALWRERTMYDVEGGGEALDLRANLLFTARTFISGLGGVKRAEAAAILEEFFNVEDNVIATEDEIVDVNGKAIYVGAKVRDEHPIGGGDPVTGTISAIHSTSDNDGAPPTVLVTWPGQEELPEELGTDVRDYAQEGPSGPYVYVCDEAEVVG